MRLASTTPRDELTHTVFRLKRTITRLPFRRSRRIDRRRWRIRDEGATGRGAKPKAGLCGFSVSHLRIPDMRHPWELDRDVINPGPEAGDLGFPARIADALSIIIDGPIGAAAFNNEFGRPNLLGYFRTTSKTLAAGATAITSRS